MRNYLNLLKAPGIVKVLIAQLLARFSFGMQTIAFVIHLQVTFHNYTIPGIAIGMSTVGSALSSPLLGRWMARSGIRVVILTGAIITPVMTLLIAFTPISPTVAVAFAFLLGLGTAPIQAASRAVYATLVDESKRNSLFSIDAILQEVIWIIGPVLATVLIATSNTIVPLVLMALLQFGGGFWFGTMHEVHNAPIPRSNRKLGGVLRQPIVQLSIVQNLLFVGAFSALEVGIVAHVGQANAGFVISALSIGSIFGGLAFGNSARTPWALSKQFAVVLFGDGLLFLNLDSNVWLSVGMFVAGIGVAPVFSTLSAIVAKKVRLDDTTEVYGWISTGQNIGYGACATVAGLLIDHVNSVATFGFAFGLDALCLVLAILTVKMLPSFKAQA